MVSHALTQLIKPTHRFNAIALPNNSARSVAMMANSASA